MNHLPACSPEELNYSQELSQIIQSQMKTHHGKISFRYFMELALYTPHLGYYSGPRYKIGHQGDFITAPELSPLFSYSLAQQCAQVLKTIPDAIILEFGAGNGCLAADSLLELERLGHLPAQYWILELSANLKQLQLETLQHKCPQHLHRVKWLSTLPKTPFSGVILANEVLDAMPVNLFEIRDHQILERYVEYRQDAFHWLTQPPIEEKFKQEIAALKAQYNLNNYLSEINRHIPAWINSLYSSLGQGAVFLIDYGYSQSEYYHWQRYQGTLMCHTKHHAHTDPLILPGLQDITAHVDFTQVAHSAAAAGFDIAGYSTQAFFLMSCGLLDYVNLSAETRTQWELTQQIKKLTLPSEMGELFKVMGLTKNINKQLLGFTLQNWTDRLF